MIPSFLLDLCHLWEFAKSFLFHVLDLGDALWKKVIAGEATIVLGAGGYGLYRLLSNDKEKDKEPVPSNPNQPVMPFAPNTPITP